MRMETPATKLSSAEACRRIRIALLEDDFERAQCKTTAAMKAVYAAEDPLERAQAELHRTQMTEWSVRADLFHAKKHA